MLGGRRGWLVLPPATAANPIQNQFHRLKQVYAGYCGEGGGGGAGPQTGIYWILGWGGGVGLVLPPATAANPIQNHFHRLKQVYFSSFISKVCIVVIFPRLNVLRLRQGKRARPRIGYPIQLIDQLKFFKHVLDS